MSFKHQLVQVVYDCTVDQLTLIHIMKSKSKPPTTRMKRLLKILIAYSCIVYYIKGKETTLSESLSRTDVENADSCKSIPISFSIQEVLNKNTILKKNG